MPVRVAHVGFFADPGRRPARELLRAWPTLTHMARAARTADIDVTVVQNAATRESLVTDDVRCEFMPLEMIFELLRSEGFDILHFRGASFPREIRRALHESPAAGSVVQLHADAVPPFWRRAQLRRALSSVNAVFCTAANAAQPFIDNGLFRSDVRVFEVPGASSDFAPGDVASARAQTGMYGSPCALWVGRLDSNKDPLTILAAAQIAKRFLPDLHLWMYFTEAPELERAKEFVRQQGLESLVHFIGALPHEQIEDCFRAADIFMLGSHHEATGFALIEALACGAAPIVTDIPAFRAVLGKDYPRLFRPGDGEALAAHIARSAAEERTALRREARAVFERTASFEAIGAKLAAAYNTLVRT